MAGPEERLKAPCGKFRSAGEEDIHGCGTRSGLRERQRFGSRRITSRRGPPASGRLAELFLKFRLDALLLEARQIVDENFTLEVIHFVLNADREEFLRDDGKGSSV